VGYPQHGWRLLPLAATRAREFAKTHEGYAAFFTSGIHNFWSYLARDLDIPPNTLWNWTQQDKVDAGEGTPDQMTSDEKQELARLRRENLRLRMERDFLKKAAAFFAKDGENDLS